MVGVDRSVRGLYDRIITGTHSQGWLAAAAVVVVVVAGGWASSARAATIVVSTNLDPGPAGTCSLREAILSSDMDVSDGGGCTAGTSGGNTIELAPSTTYDLTIAPNGGGDGTTGELKVTTPVTIDGAGSTIRQTKTDRVLDVASANVQISDLTVESGAPPSPGDGGGILVESGGALTLTGSTVSDNSAVDGGGIDNQGETTVQGTTISSNTASNAGGGVFNDGTMTITGGVIGGSGAANTARDGAGVLNDVFDGGFTVTGTTVSDNVSSVSAGGVWLYGGTLDDVVVSGNSAVDFGGGVFADSEFAQSAVITDSTISGNSVGGASATSEPLGGGIYTFSPLTLTDSWVHDNIASSNLTPAGGGGGIAFSGTFRGVLNIAGSTIGPGNEATNGDGIELDKGSNNFSATADVTRSTIVGNSHGVQAGLGGGLYVGASMTADLRDVTIASNAAGFAATDGGAVYATTGGSVSFENTLVAQPGDDNCYTSGVASSVFTSLGGDEEYGDTNDADSCNFSAAHDTFSAIDLTGSQLLPLADNGGPTETMALTAGSPPVDTGFGCQPTDQRGVPRPQGPACDSGAYELDTTPLAVTISSGPSGNVTSPNVSFSFSANQPATFQCQLDGSALAACSSPFSAGSLGLGSHTFTVQGTDIPGNHNTAARTFTIVSAPPAPTCQPVHVSTSQNQPIVVQLNCSDSAGATLTYAIDTGPGHGSLDAVNQADGRVSYTPKAGYSGPDRFTYQASSSDATAATQTVSITVTPSGHAGSTPPAITALRVTPSRLTAAASGGSITTPPKSSRTRHKKKPSGARIRYTDTEAAAIKFTVLRPRPGIRTTHGCVAPPRHVSKSAKVRGCTRWVTAGHFSHRDNTGANSFHFTGRVAGRKLKPGKYRLRAVPTLADRTGTPAITTFTIVG